MKKYIVILNLLGYPKMISVEDFIEENVKKAIAQTFKLDVEHLKRLCNDNNHIIYGVKEIYPSLKDKLSSVNIFYSEYPALHSHYIRILLATS